MDTLRFVIADGNKINQYIIHFMLKDRFVNFHFAENGEEAILAIDADLEKPIDKTRLLEKVQSCMVGN